MRLAPAHPRGGFFLPASKGAYLPRPPPDTGGGERQRLPSPPTPLPQGEGRTTTATEVRGRGQADATTKRPAQAGKPEPRDNHTWGTVPLLLVFLDDRLPSLSRSLRTATAWTGNLRQAQVRWMPVLQDKLLRASRHLLPCLSALLTPQREQLRKISRKNAAGGAKKLLQQTQFVVCLW